MKPFINNAAEKRKREAARLKWQQEKADRKQQREAERLARDSSDPEEDPDIAGIVPGPQPPHE